MSFIYKMKFCIAYQHQLYEYEKVEIIDVNPIENIVVKEPVKIIIDENPIEVIVEPIVIATPIKKVEDPVVKSVVFQLFEPLVEEIPIVTKPVVEAIVTETKPVIDEIPPEFTFVDIYQEFDDKNL